MMVTRLSAGSSHGPMFKWVMPESIRCRSSIERGFAIELCGAFYSPAFVHARRWTGALRLGSLFRAVGGIDPEFDHIVDDTAPQRFRHDSDEGAAVHCASDIGTDPCKFIEVVPHNPGTIVQSEMGRHPWRDRNCEAGIVIPRRDGRRYGVTTRK